MAYFPSDCISLASFYALDGHQDELDLVLSEAEDSNAVVFVIRHVSGLLLDHVRRFSGCFWE